MPEDDKKDNKTKNLQIPCTEKWYLGLQSDAVRLGFDTANYVRMAIHNQRQRDKLGEE